jgi:hypothetical protein
LVKVEDTVVPGQLIATVDESTADAGLFAADAAAAAAAAAAPAKPASTGGAAAGSGGGGGTGRVPGIRFPLRATPDGQRISSLPAAEAAKWLQQAGSGAGAAAAAAAAPAAPAAAAPAAASGGAAAAAALHAAHVQTPMSASAEAVGKTGRAKVGGGF